jgi:hypothetical protein
MPEKKRLHDGTTKYAEPVAVRIGEFHVEGYLPQNLGAAFKQTLFTLGYETHEDIEVFGPITKNSGSAAEWHFDRCELILPDDIVDWDPLNLVVWSNTKSTEVLDPDSCEELHFRPNDIILIDNRRALHRAPLRDDLPRWFIRTRNVRRRMEPGTGGEDNF